MADSLRDQLLKSGIVKQVREEKRPSAPPSGKPFQQRHGGSPSKGGKPGQHKPHGKPSAPKSQEEIDLAKAYAIRAQTEANERKRAEQAAAEEARVRRERKIQQLLEGKTLNKPDVDHVRHFEYGGKIRRVHVDADQLKAINAGELGVVQQQGRYLV